MSLCARDIRFSYRAGREVLSGLSAAFAPGRVAAVVGPNGSGKTTLLRLLLGLLEPGSGVVELDGKGVAGMSREARAARLAYVPQASSVGLGFSARRVVEMGRVSRGGANGAVERALERLDLVGLAGRPFAELSAGQRQRVTLARAIAQLDGGGSTGQTRALLADEPFSAMDPRHGLSAGRILREIADAGAAVVVVLHDLAAVLAIADDAVVLGQGGRVERAGPVRAAVTPEVLERVFGAPFVGAVDPSRPGEVVALQARWEERGRESGDGGRAGGGRG